MKFKEFNLKSEHIATLEEMYIENPTNIQHKVIPIMRKKRDVLAKAQTGTGKTLAFLLPIMEEIEEQDMETNTLIIVPTRELANQITDVARKFKKYRNIGIVNVSGGHNVNSQIQNLKSNANLVVGTPGRLLDHLRRGTINFKYLKTVVIDEVDQILAFGFLEDMDLLMNKLPKYKQICMFSATISQEVKKLSQRFLNNPIYLEADEEQIVLDNIKQLVVRTTESRRLSSLLNMMDVLNPFMCMIFCNSKKTAEELYNKMIESKFSNMDLLHGELSQNKREQILKKFRALKTQYLITTDLSARGIDIEGVTHVFNYEIPRDTEYYIHRVGRTGRMNHDGYAISFVSEKDEAALQKIQNKIKQSLVSIYDTRDREREKMIYPYKQKSYYNKNG